MNWTAQADLRALVERLDALAARRLATRPRTDAASTRATRLADHLAGHVRVRAASLDAPLLVVLVGPTGAGKSTVFNTIAGRAASETGALPPTTRVAVVLVHPDDRAGLAEGTFARVPPSLIRFVEDATIERGLVLVDAPDIDSIEHANRDLTDRLIEAADLALFVTTATRYADRVPWAVLDRVRGRGLPFLVILNRLPTESGEREEVLADLGRLLDEFGFSPPPMVVGVDEGRLAGDGQSLDRDSIRPVLDRVAALRGDREARRELAARALSGSLAGIGGLVDRMADDVTQNSIDAESLRRITRDSYAREL